MNKTTAKRFSRFCYRYHRPVWEKIFGAPANRGMVAGSNRFLLMAYLQNHHNPTSFKRLCKRAKLDFGGYCAGAGNTEVMRITFFCFFLMQLAVSNAQSIIDIRTDAQMLNLATQATYLEDPGGKLTLSELRQPARAARFQPIKTRVVNFGVSTSAFWIRARLRNHTDASVLIEVGNNSLSDIRLYEVTGNTVVRKFHTGNWQRFAERYLQNVHYLFPLGIKMGGESTVYLRVQHARGLQFRLKAGTLGSFYEAGSRRDLLEGLYYGFMLVMILYNLFLFFSLRDNAYFFYVLYIFFMGLLIATINGYAFRFLWPSYPSFNLYEDLIAAFAGIAGILFVARFLNTRKNAPFYHAVFLVLLAVYLLATLLILSKQFQSGILLIEINTLVLVFSFFLAAYQTMRNGYKPARFFLIAWSFLLVSVIIFIMTNFNLIASSTFTSYSMQIGSALEALLLSMALANRINVYKKEKSRAEQEALQSLEKNKKLIEEQNIMLERKVAERTEALKKTNEELVLAMSNLKETQAQLVQREKMASLGELTAGIAHEIQNPLNFVNNFSEVSSELLDDLKEELAEGNTEAATGIADDLKANLQKILSHGRRADNIVRSMLAHSRQTPSVREPVALESIIEESLRLSYQAIRVSDKTFTPVIETHFDETLGKVDVVAQDMVRVLLNIFNNAFYAMREKKKQRGESYQPVLSVTTCKDESAAIITIRDNGTAIPPKLIDKIFQPFFTTKPSGEGTGLGLSLSYDIITKGHGGELRVENREGEGCMFTIVLPANVLNHKTGVEEINELD